MIRRAIPAFNRQRIALLAVAALALAIPVVRSASSARAGASPVQSVVIDGRGNGHGAGLSQWGALGWATVYGKTWQEILGIYYSGTTLDTVRDSDFRRTPIGRMQVQLSALDGLQTAVISESNALSTTADPSGRTWSALVAREIPGRNNTYDVWAHATPACPTGADALNPPDGDDGSDTTLPDGSTTSTPAESSSTTAPASSTTVANTSSTAAGSPLAPARLEGAAAPGAAAPAGWVRVATGVTGPITFTTAKADRADAVSPRDVIGVCQKNRSLRYYRGTISAVNNAAGRNYTFNTVLLEDYVRGVVPRESPASWAKVGGGKGIHALRAQAVAARSYALAANPRSSGAKICDTSSCQVYGGTAIRPRVGGKLTKLENSASTQAVADTAGQILRYENGGIAWTVFSSSNGGRTINNGIYAAIDDPGDAIAANGHHAWSISVPAAKILKVWPQLGELINIRVTKRTGGGVWDGWVDKMVLEGTNTTLNLTGDQFRRGLKLKSRYLNFTLLREPGKDEVGPGLFVGDGVSAASAKELDLLVGGAYDITWDNKAGRCIGKTSAGACSTNHALAAIKQAATPAFAIVQLGYQDDPAAVTASIDSVMASLLQRGVSRVLWVNLSERRHGADGVSPFAPANAALAEAATRWPQLSVLDWNAASANDDGDRWFVRGTTAKPDFVTLTPAGRNRFALFIRTQLDDLRAQGLLPATVNTTPVTVDPNWVPPSTVAPSTSAPTSSSGLPTSVDLTASTVGTSATSPTTASTSAAPTTLAAIKKRVLRIGTTGSLVRTLQTRLKSLGYPVDVDGRFGKNTRKQVRAFQRANGLTPDGVVGARTWRALGI